MREKIEECVDNIQTVDNIENEEYLNVIVKLSEDIFHDFKNILATISGLSQLTALKTTSEEVKKNLCIINNATFQCREAIDRFYSLVKGHNVDKMENISLGNIIFNTLDMVKHRINIPTDEENQIELSLNINSFSKIYCNEYKMKQAILNILLNALDAMEETGGILEINLFESFNTLILEICDTGVGIPEENLEKIFESNFTTKGKKGTGFGLRISKSIFEEYGGEITVESKLGIGSKFKINFPISEYNSIEVKQ